MNKNFYILLFICFSGCLKIDVFERNVHIPEQAWSYNFKPSFNFAISDTSSSYNIFIVLRHTDAYKYNNIWLSIGSHAPGDTTRFQNINLILANDATGWHGVGMDDIYEIRKNISPGPVHFTKSGSYQFTVAQIMRENPLMHVLDVGIRVEKER